MARIVVLMTDHVDGRSAADQQFLTAMKRGRRARRMSQTELADEVKKRGWGEARQAIISRIELGEREVRLGEAYLIAQVLGMSVEAMAAPDDVHLLLRDLDSNAEQVKDQVGTVTMNLEILSRYVDHLRADRERALAYLEDQATTPHADSIRRAVDSADEALLEAAKVGG